MESARPADGLLLLPKQRLQILVAHERASRNRPSYLAQVHQGPTMVRRAQLNSRLFI